MTQLLERWSCARISDRPRMWDHFALGRGLVTKQIHVVVSELRGNANLFDRPNPADVAGKICNDPLPRINSRAWPH